ncbi:MAG: DUF3574 domain-containing protein [Psychrosphaera sp.]|nr:DUF3574 domain-containing protein [Psychrosphaera sp.]
MTLSKTLFLLLGLMLISCTSTADMTVAKVDQKQDQNYRVRLYFGLSLPGGGGVSLKQWQAFQQNVLVANFDGFNVVDSTGYYKGEPERSKIVTILTNQSGMKAVKKVARQYAAKFQQESVMMVKIKVDEWTFIKAAP